MGNVKRLLKKGVCIPRPESVNIGNEVNTDNISPDVTLYPGCKIYGASTLILQGSKLGYEAPVTVQDCQIGPKVQLKGGYFKQAVFLEKSSAGMGAHVREGTILEEEAGIAHNVGLKQTILFPFVTLGSLINFCDCFMSGGTSRKDHSEVGSSYIHFNYTPNQDKATASLLGDVPKGVMLNQRPIFLGGQGGLVGPSRLNFGTVIAAGSVFRKDELRPGRLIVAGGLPNGNMAFSMGMYRNVKRILVNNVIYIANLMALMHWYNNVRSVFVSDQFPQSLLNALKDKLQMGINERVKRLKLLSQKMPDSIAAYTSKDAAFILQQQEFFEKWLELEDFFTNQAQNIQGNDKLQDDFLEKFLQKSGHSYLETIKKLDPEHAHTGSQWLQSIVTQITTGFFEKMPVFG